MIEVRIMLNRALRTGLLVGVFSLVLLGCLIHQAAAQSDTLVVVFNWSFQDVSWGPWKVELSRQVYDYYDSLSATELCETYTIQLSNEIRIWDYKYFATWEEKLIQDLARTLEVAAENSKYDYYDEAGFILAFVQSIPSKTYQERVRFPIETLVEGGACSDKSILYATLMIVLQYDVVFLHIPSDNAQNSHLAVGVRGIDYPGGTYYVYNGKQYYYCETTKLDQKFGEISPEMKKDAYILDAYCSQPIPEFPQDPVLVIAGLASITLVLTRHARKNERYKR